MIGKYQSLGRITDEENNALRDRSGTQRCGHRLRIRQKGREQCGEHCGSANRGRFDHCGGQDSRDNSDGGGCFGHGGEVTPENTQYPKKLAENLVMTALCGWLVVRPRSLFSLDQALFGSPIRFSEESRDDIAEMTETEE